MAHFDKGDGETMSFGRIVDREPDEFGSMLIMTTQPFWSFTSRPNVFPWFSIVVSICVNACCLFWGGREDGEGEEQLK